jgi:hypothetical protein
MLLEHVGLEVSSGFSTVWCVEIRYKLSSLDFAAVETVHLQALLPDV